jgi:hypothetical protein
VAEPKSLFAEDLRGAQDSLRGAQMTASILTVRQNFNFINLHDLSRS